MTQIENFAFLDAFCVNKKSNIFKFSDSFVNMNGDNGAYFSVKDMTDKIKEGYLISATALVVIKNNRMEKLLCIKRSTDAKFDPAFGRHQQEE